MTSVTLSSSSGQLNGGYSSSVTEEISSRKVGFDATRTTKRSLAITSSESCKKRRKQSTPIRISTTDSEASPSNSLEGKPPVLSPDTSHRCSICKLYFDHVEQLQNHIITDHPPLECKKEPEEHPATPSSLLYLEASETTPIVSVMRPEVQWMNDIQNLPFSPANPMFMALPQFAQPENMPMKPIRIFNPDAYCELCSKEFCNKYFLKTHKANKHGIYTDTPTSDALQSSSLGNNLKLSSNLPSLELPTIKTEPKTPVNTLNPYTSIFPNSFQNQIAVNLSDNKPNESATIANGQSSSSESDKNFPEDQAGEDFSSPSNTQTESTSIKNDSKGIFHDTSNKLPTEQQSRELDLSFRLRRLGVMNPKAFCEICCKEYCNKYFLRTHKLKRHGIYIPEDKEKDIGSEETNVNFPLSNNVQTSPLNLIMTEQTSSDCKTTSPSNISCDICNIKFQNASLAHLHNVSVHGKLCNKDEEVEKNLQGMKKLPEMLKSPEKSLNAEAISEDLQKLQTMILQLNDLESCKVSTTCNVCNKEFENQFYLHAHMMSEHGTLLEEVRDAEKSGEPENTLNNNTLCDMCGKEVQSAEEMTRHIIEFHSNNQSSSENAKDDFNGYNSGEKLANRLSLSTGHIVERRVSTNVTPTSSYCEICNKELCNKYFMKTHMQRMHGIEIENGAQIGGVVCDICNKELCSKYFLRVHKHNTHGIIEYGSNLLPSRKSESELLSLQPPPTPTEPDQALKPGDLADMSHRYFTHFTEVCTICSRRFRSTKWLKAHLITDHGQAGAEKWAEIEHQLQQHRSNFKSSTTVTTAERTSPSLRIPNGGQEQATQKMGIQNFISTLFGADETSAKIYQCSYCPFATPLLPLLFVHERSHAMNLEDTPLKCPACPQNFPERELLQRHIFTQHPILIPSMVKEEETGKDNVQDLDTENEQGVETKAKKQLSSSMNVKQIELSSEIGQSLKDVAKRMQWPATYAIPQDQSQTPDQDQEVSMSATTFPSKPPGYVMQAFLLEESASEKRVMPSVVFLPMLQKQPAPITVTFTLTPA